MKPGALLYLLFFGIVLHAQTESVVHFEHEMRRIILTAHDSGIESLTFRINAYQLNGKNGEKRKVKIHFVNDSVFERKIRFKKETFIIRQRNIFPYDPKAKNQPVFSSLHMKDSANCRVIWGEAYEGMPDSSHISYCRFTYDSAHRETDYYYTFSQVCFHRTTRYEGDSVSYVEFRKLEADTMRLLFNEYIYESYNADSSFYIRVVKKRLLPNEIRAVDGDIWMEYRTFVTYDSKGRIVAIRQEEGMRHSRGANFSDTVNTMKVIYQ